MTRTFTSAVLAFAVLGAQPVLAGDLPSFGIPFQVAAENCTAAGQREASNRGAKLVQAQSVTQGGETKCKVVLLIPASDGQHPRREEVVVNP